MRNIENLKTIIIVLTFLVENNVSYNYTLQ